MASNDKRSSEAALAFIERLTGVARRLSAHDVVVSELHCDWRADAAIVEPEPWRRLLDRSFDDSEQAMEFAERYARDWATGMTQMNG